MKLAIVGGRDFTNFDLLCEECNEILKGEKDITIVSGGASGADTLAEKYADENGYGKDIKYAEWDNLEAVPCVIKYNKYGKPYNALAGFNRNKDIVAVADRVIAFWDGESKGTKDSINLAKKLGKECIIVNY